MVNWKDLSSLQEGCVSTPETCPYRSGSLFSCFVMERTLCWHHIELNIIWGLKCRGWGEMATSGGGYTSVWNTQHGGGCLKITDDVGKQHSSVDKDFIEFERPKREQSIQLKKNGIHMQYTICAGNINGCHVFNATSCDYLSTASFILQRRTRVGFWCHKNVLIFRVKT